MSRSHLASTHPVVRMDYPLRVMGQFFVLVTVSSAMNGGVRPLWLWGALLVSSLVWPHLAYRLGSVAADGKRAELRNLLGDSAIIGWWISQLSFALWPSTAFVAAVTMGNLAVGGVRQGIRSLGVMAGVMLAYWASLGSRFDPESDLRTAMISITAILLFTAFLAVQTYERTRRLVESRRSLEKQRDEIVLKNSEIEEARNAADTANRAKSAFLGNMNHELHTPLHAIIGYTELVSDEVQSYANDAVDTDLARIKTSAQHLLGIVDSVLDFTRVESGKVELQFESVDAKTLCSELAADLGRRVAVNRNRLEVHVDDNARWVHADKIRLEQVLRGLLQNATNFTQDGKIRLEVSKEQGEIAFLVSDTGEGIPEGKLGDIFAPFSQADDSTTRRVGGAGLGLALCRELCRLMGGELGVTSELGKGSKFGIRLPGAEAPADGDRAEQPESLVSNPVLAELGSPDAQRPPSPEDSPTGSGESEEIPSSRKHDLLTPVNHIIGYGELLAEDAADADQQDLLSGLSKICSNGRSLEKIITFQFESAKKTGTGVSAARFHAEMDPVLLELKFVADDLIERATKDMEIEEDLTKIKTAIRNLTELTHKEPA